MLNYFKRMSKTVKIIGSVILTVAFFCFLFSLNIERIASYSINKFLGLTLKVEDINLSLGNIKFKNLQLFDKKDRLALDAPEIRLDYSLSKLKELSINEAKIFIISDEDGINLANLIDKKEKESDKENKKDKEKNKDEKEQDLTSLPIDKINIRNLDLSYESIKYGTEVKKELKNINIFVESGKNKGIIANLNIDNNLEQIDLVYKNTEEPFYLDLKISEMDLKNYEDLLKLEVPKLKKIAGKIKTDTVISHKNNSGFANIENLELYYSDVESDIKADLDIKLDKEDIDIILDYEIFGEKNQLESMYKDGELYSVVQIKNLNEAKLSKIVPLRKKKIDLSKIDIEDVILLTQYNKTDGLRIKFDLIPNKAQIGAISLDGIKANLSLKDKIALIDNSYIKLKIADMPARMSLEGSSDIEDRSADLIFQIQNLDKNSNLIPDFKGFFNIKDEEENIKLKLNSNIINFEAVYDKAKTILNLSNPDFNFSYDKKEKKITGTGELDFLIYGLKNQIKFNIDDSEGQKIIFEKLKIEDEKDSWRKLEAEGYYDLTLKDFSFDYDATELTISRLYKGDDINFTFKGKGKFEKYSNILSGLGNITGLNLEFLGEINSITGDYSLNINENNELELQFDGIAEELIYHDFKFKDVLVQLSFEKNMLNIKKIGNDFLDISGKINRLTQDSDLKLTIKNLTNKEINFKKLDFNLKNIIAVIKGNIKNPDIDLKINNSEIYLNNKITQISGNLNMKDKKLNLSNLKINNNKITGKYDLETKKYNANILINDNIKNYIDKENLTYNLKGLLKVSGIDGKLEANLKLDGLDGKLDNSSLPNLNLNANYSAQNYSDGLISLKNLSLYNSTLKELLNLNGTIDLKNKISNIRSVNSIDLADLLEYTKQKNLKGKLNLNLGIVGSLDKLLYNLSLASDKIQFKEYDVDNINLSLKGNKDLLKLDNLSFSFLDNIILGSGFYDISNKKYDINLKNKNLIAVNDLNKILNNERLNNLQGDVNFDISLKNSGLNGFIKTNNINFILEKENINLENLESDIEIIENKINFKKFLANINDGSLALDGYINLPRDFKNIQDNLDYLLNLKVNEVKYNKKDVANVQISSNIEASNKKIRGNIYIDDAVIYDIPNDYKNIWSIIKKQISKKKKEKSETVAEKQAKKVAKEKQKKLIREFSEKLDEVEVIVKTKNPIILNMDDFNIAIGELKGKVDVDLELKGGKGKYNIFGQTEIDNGYLYVNTNKFILDRALVSFTDTLTYLPDINPDIFIDTIINMDEEELYFEIYGRMKRLMYTLSSDEERIRGDFNSLLVKSNDYLILEGNSSKIYEKFMKSIIAGQITQTVFSPITKGVKKVLNLSKLMIKPEVSIYDVDSRIYSPNSNERNFEVYDLGLKIEAEKELYKDLIYLYGNAKLLDSNKKPEIWQASNKSGLRDYDIGLEYRTTDDKIFGVGVGTVSDRYIHEDKNQHKRNYHIDFKFRKKYNNLSEILSF